MTLTGIVLSFVLWIMMPACAVVAAVLAWLAFHRPVLGGWTLPVAIAILVLPFLVMVVAEPDKGLEYAFSDYSPYMFSVGVGTVIVIAVVRRAWRES